MTGTCTPSPLTRSANAQLRTYHDHFAVVTCFLQQPHGRLAVQPEPYRHEVTARATDDAETAALASAHRIVTANTSEAVAEQFADERIGGEI